MPLRDFRGPSKGARDVSVALSDKERALVQRYADQEGITFEEAVEKLLGQGLANRVRKRTGRSPSASVMRFRRGGRR